MPDSKAKKTWDKANTVMLCAKLNQHTDADILQYLACQPSKQGTIKQALREKIARETQETQET